MRKVVGSKSAAFLAAAVAILTVAFAAEPYYAAQVVPSESLAQALQKKIDTIKAAHAAGNGNGRRTVDVSEVELESYVLFHLREDIPARIDSIDVHLTDGAVAADAKLTFPPDATGSTVMDLLISGTHNFFIKGKLAAAGTRGKFDLESVKIDGIPVPNLLIDTLVNKFVKPKYPDVDLNEPFTMPWGIQSLLISTGKTVVVY